MNDTTFDSVVQISDNTPFTGTFEAGNPLKAIDWAMASPARKTDRSVLLAIVRHVNRAGEAWPSIERIARLADVSIRRVQQAVKTLVELGLIVLRKRPGRTTVYRFVHAVVKGDPRSFCTPPPQNSSSTPLKEEVMEETKTVLSADPQPRGPARPPVYEIPPVREEVRDADLGIDRLARRFDPELRRQSEEVMAHWAETFGGRARLDRSRLNTILNALVTFDVGELKQAITGFSFSEWHAKRRIKSVAIVLKDADSIERFMRMAENPREEGADHTPMTQAQHQIEAEQVRELAKKAGIDRRKDVTAYMMFCDEFQRAKERARQGIAQPWEKEAPEPRRGDRGPSTPKLLNVLDIPIGGSQ